MRRHLPLLLLLALAGCEHVSGEEVATFLGSGLGAAAGAYTATAVAHAEPGAMPVIEAADGGAALDWPDAGGACVGVGDRICCTRRGLEELLAPELVLPDAGS
jgi:hypothetical protein